MAEPISEGSETAPSVAGPKTIFVVDRTPEADGIVATLGAVGYAVSRVSRAMVSSRLVAERPRAIVIDVDTDGVVTELIELRQLPGARAIHFIHLGTGRSAIANADDAQANEGSAYFTRPVDLEALVRKLEVLIGAPRDEEGPAHSLLPKSGRLASDMPSLPAPGVRIPQSPLPQLHTPRPPLSTSSLDALVEAPRSLATLGTVSNELQELLADAEMRAALTADAELPLPSPDEEIESVLPAEMLASLDEPLPIDDDDDDDVAQEGPRPNETSPGREGAFTKGTTSGGSRSPTTGSGREARTSERRQASDPPRTQQTTGGGSALTPLSPRSAERPAEIFAPLPRPEPPPREPTWRPVSTAPSPTIAEALEPAITARPADGPTLLGRGDAVRVVADAIAQRKTGALCFEHEGAIRRVVFREGDLVTAASSDERESLVAFLAARGELPREETARLASKVPLHGRHAGAALVAHGALAQEHLWDVLRAHAEWIAGGVLRQPSGTVHLESDPPGRLRAEPSVFGASPGPSIFVDLVRRSIPAEEALQRMGGESSRMAEGANYPLLVECNLSAGEHELLSRMRGETLANVIARSADPEFVAVVFALSLLGVIEIVVAPNFGRNVPRPEHDIDAQALDDDAVRARIRARLELVEDGDYFAVLGVARDATSYEVKRAYLELRRGFEPARILGPRLFDLEADVRKILTVIDEAYEILRDGPRRERYRRAIDARP